MLIFPNVINPTNLTDLTRDSRENSIVQLPKWPHLRTMFSEETFASFGFESIFLHLEIISNGRPIKVLNDRSDISKSKSLNNTTISPEQQGKLQCEILLFFLIPD